VPAAAARLHADGSPPFSVRHTDDPAARGAELARALLAGLEGGRTTVVLKCVGRSAMPNAAKVRAPGACPPNDWQARLSSPGFRIHPRVRPSGLLFVRMCLHWFAQHDTHAQTRRPS
jgi:hypothetical protein